MEQWNGEERRELTLSVILDRLKEIKDDSISTRREIGEHFSNINKNIIELGQNLVENSTEIANLKEAQKDMQNKMVIMSNDIHGVQSLRNYVGDMGRLEKRVEKIEIAVCENKEVAEKSLEDYKEEHKKEHEAVETVKKTDWQWKLMAGVAVLAAATPFIVKLIGW